MGPIKVAEGDSQEEICRQQVELFSEANFLLGLPADMAAALQILSDGGCTCSLSSVNRIDMAAVLQTEPGLDSIG